MNYYALAVFLSLTIGGGLAIGYLTRPDDWYAGLAKPPFNPPDWVFGPVWTVLYVMIAVAGFRIFMRAPHDAAMAFWVAGLALNFLWSPVFFGLRRPVPALVVVLTLWATIVAFIVLSWPIDLAAALLFVPYAAWVTFASVLNAAIVRLN